MAKIGNLITMTDDQEGASPRIITRDDRFASISAQIDIARGKVTGAYSYFAFGETTLVAGVQKLVWEDGMPNTFTVPSGIQLTLVSSSASDTSGIVLVYLDGNLNVQHETITLNGVTPVLSVATDVRAINNMFSVTGPVIGNISVTSGGTTYAYIPAGDDQFNSTLQRVPAGKRLMISSIYAGSVSATADAQAIIKIETTQVNGSSFQEQGYLFPVGAVASQSNSVTLSGSGAMPIRAGEFVAFTAQADKAAVVTAGFFGWIEDE